MDLMQVNVELLPDTDLDKRGEAEKDLQKYIKDIIGISTRVIVHLENGVARSEGKATRVIDKRDL